MKRKAQQFVSADGPKPPPLDILQPASYRASYRLHENCRAVVNFRVKGQSVCATQKHTLKNTIVKIACFLISTEKENRYINTQSYQNSWLAMEVSIINPRAAEN